MLSALSCHAERSEASRPDLTLCSGTQAVYNAIPVMLSAAKHIGAIGLHGMVDSIQ
jgi:hypothetical protein